MDDWGYGLLAVGIFFIIAAMFSLGRSRKQRSSGRETARDHVDRARQKQGVRDELEALMVDINRMAKDLGGQLDAKIVRIEQANREAEQRIAQLEALQHTLAQPNRSHAPADTNQPDPPDGPPPAETPTQEQPEPATAHLTKPADPADPLTEKVYALADQGVGPGDIAQQLDEHIGKVELILALRTS